MWEGRNITIENNSESFTPSDITGGQNIWGSTAYQSCTSGNSSTFCGTNFDEYQPGYYPGGTAAGPYFKYEEEMEDAFMANSNFETPITSHWLGSPAGNDGETAWNITWTGNTYTGPIYFYTGTYGNCDLPSPWSCFVNVSSWESSASGGWDNDNSSTSAPTVSISSQASDTEIKGTSVVVDSTATANNGGSITSCQLSLGGVNIGPAVTSSPYNFAFNTLTTDSGSSFADGLYNLTVTCLDSGSNSGSSIVPVYVSNGDLNGDGHVNISDLAIMAGHWGQTDSNYADGNITGQGTINISDLSVLAANWGKSW